MPNVFDFAVPGAKKIVRSVRPQMFRRGPGAPGVRQGPEGRPSEIGGEMPQLAPEQVATVRERLRQRFGEPQFAPSGPMAQQTGGMAPQEQIAPPPIGMQDGGGGAAPMKDMSDGGAVAPGMPMKEPGGFAGLPRPEEDPNDPRKSFGGEISPRY